MSLFNLPLEIQGLILELQPRDTLLALRATCSTALSQVNPRVFSTVRLDPHLIDALASDSCTFAGLVQTLCWKYTLDTASTPQLFQRWSRLSRLPALKQLEIQVVGEKHRVSRKDFPPLHMFHDLHALTVAFSGDIPTAYGEEEIAAAINASPDLVNLQIRNLTGTPCFSRVKKCLPLPGLLSSRMTALEKLQIHHVPFPGHGLRQVISSNLRELSVSTRSGGRGIKSDWGAFWAALGTSGVILSSLRVSGSERAMDKLFTYLTSYTGLRLLDISELVMDDKKAEDDAGDIFWRDVVPHHDATLVTLSIAPNYEGGWCYGPMAAVSLRNCSALRQLTISLCDVDPSWASGQVRALQADGVTFSNPLGPDGAAENCAALVACGLPMPLIQLHLNTVQEESDRASDLVLLKNPGREIDSPNTYAAYQRHRITVWRIQEVLLGIRAPEVVSTKWPWVFAVASSKPRSRHRDSDGYWSYISERDGYASA